MAKPPKEMSPSKLLLLMFFSLILIQLICLATAQPEPVAYICSEKGNFTSNSTYESNLNLLFASLPSNPEFSNGFVNTSLGKNTDKVEAIALCKGYTKTDECVKCINKSGQSLKQLCPNDVEAIVWYDDCMLRYSNRALSGNMEFNPFTWTNNIHNVSHVNQFHVELNDLLSNLTARAASGDSHLKFAAGNVTAPDNLPVHAMVQCTPDLSKDSCALCLNLATQLIVRCCTGKQGGRVLSPSCNFRYERYIFYDPAAELVAQSPPPAIPAAPPPTTSTATLTGTRSNIAPILAAGILQVLFLGYFTKTPRLKG